MFGKIYSHCARLRAIMQLQLSAAHVIDRPEEQQMSSHSNEVTGSFVCVRTSWTRTNCGKCSSKLLSLGDLALCFGLTLLLQL